MSTIRGAVDIPDLFPDPEAQLLGSGKIHRFFLPRGAQSFDQDGY